MNDVRFTIKVLRKIVDYIASEEFTSLYILIEGEIKTVMTDEKGDFMHIEDIKALNQWQRYLRAIINRQYLPLQKKSAS